MAEGFEPNHVPQRSRRDKLRVAAGEPSSTPFLPYDHPFLMPSDLLSCTAAANHHALLSGGDKVKDEAVVCRSLVPSSSSVGNPHQLYGMDPPSLAVNPTCSTAIHDLASGGAFLYAPQTLQDLRDLAHSYNSALSLSLSSHGNASDNNRPVSDNLSLLLELNLQQYGSTSVSTAGYLIPTAISVGVGRGLPYTESSRSAVPLGPFTGYSLILKGSRFLLPAQQLLEELCDVGCSRAVEKIAEADPSLAVDELEIESILNIEESSSSSSGGADGADVRRKKSRLISMLNEVCRSYKQYFQQIQDVVASFEYVAGFCNAAPYANLALKAMSKYFRSLKSVIIDQLHLNKEQVNPRRDEGYPRLGNKDANPYGQRAFSNSGFYDHHQLVWRPQRGLPDRAVTVLRAWLFEHFLHLYPTDTDKIMLAKQTGLSRSQVSNWFINARVRLWKPMVEEIHMLETQQAQKASNLLREDHNNADINSSRTLDHHLPLASEAPSTSMPRVHESLPNKRTRNDVPEFPLRNDGDISHHLSYDPRVHYQHVSVGDQGIRNRLSNSVSLTLGLHQNNNWIGLPEAYQVNATQRFAIGLEGIVRVSF